MGIQIILCVEADKKAETDAIYIKDTIYPPKGSDLLTYRHLLYIIVCYQWIVFGVGKYGGTIWTRYTCLSG